MRRRLAVSFLVLTVIVTVLGTASAAGAWPRTWRARAYELLLPGAPSRTTAHLDPAFRQKVELVMTRLRARGFQPFVRSAWRSAERQDAIYNLGRLRQRVVGGAPATNARGGRSCHNRVDDDGGPAALAVDLNDRAARTTREKARFYKALGEEARRVGLKWGGGWKRKNPVWKRYGMGWDPAHLQSKRCRPLR